MEHATRRGFLVLAGAGTAAAVGAVAVPKVFGDRSTEAANAAVDGGGPGGCGVVRRPREGRRAGRMAILVGDREVLVTDRELAARLAGATTG